jgi:hypothetical protein
LPRNGTARIAIFQLICGGDSLKYLKVPLCKRANRVASALLNLDARPLKDGKTKETNMRKYMMIVAAASLALCAAPVFAGGLKTVFKKELPGCCDAPTENNGGRADYKKQMIAGATTNQERFRAGVSIALPSPTLGIATVEDAQAADIRLILTHATADYAECSLIMVDTVKKAAKVNGAVVITTFVDFLVDVRYLWNKGDPVQRNYVGWCDIDLSTPGIQDGIPPVQTFDIATVTLVDPSEASLDRASRTLDIDFLQGSF